MVISKKRFWETKKLNLSRKIKIRRLDIPHNIYEMCDISKYWRCVLEAKGHKINLGLRPKAI